MDEIFEDTGLESKLESLKDTDTTDKVENQAEDDMIERLAKLRESPMCVEDHSHMDMVGEKEVDIDNKQITKKKDEQSCEQRNESQNEKAEKITISHEYREKEARGPCKIKAKTTCAQCQSDECASLFETKNIALVKCNKGNGSCETIKGSKSEGPAIRNLLDAEKWHDQGSSSHIKIMPHYRAAEERGRKYKIISIINNSIVDVIVDSGSFKSILHADLAKEIGLSVKQREPIRAKSATGPLIIEEEAEATLDVGIISFSIKFAIVHSDSYDKDMVILIYYFSS